MDVSFHLFRFVVSGRGLTRPAHWYYICTRQRWSVPRHTQIWAAVSPSGVRLGAPLVAPTTIPCLHRLMARAFEGVNYRFVGRLGSLCLLEQRMRIRIMIFHDDDFVVDSIVFPPPLFFRPARKIWLLWLVVMMVSLALLAAGFCDVA